MPQHLQRGALFLREFVAALLGVGDPYVKFHGHRFRLAVDGDLFAVAARYGPVGAFAFHPLCEGCQAKLERLLRLARALRRTLSRRGRRHLKRLYAQPGQPFLLLSRQLRPSGRLLLPLQPPPDVFAVHQHASLDVGQATVDEVG